METSFDEWNLKVSNLFAHLSAIKLPGLKFTTTIDADKVNFHTELPTGERFLIRARDLKISTIYMDNFENLQILQDLDDEIIDAISTGMDAIASVRSGIAKAIEGRTRFCGQKFYTISIDSKTKLVFKQIN